MIAKIIKYSMALPPFEGRIVTAYRYIQYPAWQSFDCLLFIPRLLHFVNLCHLMKLGIRNEEWIFFKSMQHSKIVTN